VWDAHWGFLRDTQPRAVVVGEWGGFCKGKDAKWQRRLARYLRERGMADNFCECCFGWMLIGSGQWASGCLFGCVVDWLTKRWITDAPVLSFIIITRADHPDWCLNPNSGDTGGILADDWKSLQIEKLQILHELQPAPSRLELAADGKSLRYHEGVEAKATGEGLVVAGPTKKKGGGWFGRLFSSSKRK
jgi:hypothetical protein